MDWKVRLTDAAEKQLSALDKPTRERVLRYFNERISGGKNPRHFGEGLSANLAGLWRYRIGDYRIVCQIEDNIVTVLVLSIAHRSVVYKG